ncbi:MAG: metallophosphoesterase, partial [Pseudomonadota bacterium]
LTRRAFLRWSAVAGMAGAGVLAGSGIAQAYGDPVIEEFNFIHPALGPMGKTITVIQVTDLHFGMFFGIQELERLVTLLNRLEGDALVITGDLFHSRMTPVESAPPILSGLRTRPLGNFAVMGNHEFFTGEERSVAAMEQCGLVVLRDRWVSFREGDGFLHLGGLDDPRVNWVWGTEFPNYGRLLRTLPREPGFRVLLSHRPAVLPLAARSEMDFVLSGHIHGGQIIVPVPGTERGLSIARTASTYTHGWYREGNCRMYLNRGAGLTFVPWRIHCPPEIAVFHLRGPKDGEVAAAEVRTSAVTGPRQSLM